MRGRKDAREKMNKEMEAAVSEALWGTPSNVTAKHRLRADGVSRARPVGRREPESKKSSGYQAKDENILLQATGTLFHY